MIISFISNTKYGIHDIGKHYGKYCKITRKADEHFSYRNIE